MQGELEKDPVKLVSFSESLARFLILNPRGQLCALDDVLIAEDYSKVAPKICPVDFHVATSLMLRVDPSNLTLVLQPRGSAAHTYFLTNIPAGADRKPIKVYETAKEIVDAAVAGNRFPVIVPEDLHRAILHTRRTMAPHLRPAPPLPVPIRYLKLRDSMPSEWLDTMGALFRITASEETDKEFPLQDKLDELNTRVKRTMVREYLTKCIWTDAAIQRIGRVTGSEDGASFRTFITGNPELASFAKTLTRSEEGQLQGISEVANVIPRMVSDMHWSSPTLHVYDQEFRERNRLKEYYSLYNGLKQLSDIGPPVLVHKQGALDSTIPVIVLKPEGASGHAVRQNACLFAIQDLVWSDKKSPF